MPNPTFTLEQLMPQKAGMVTPSGMEALRTPKNANTVHFQITKAGSLSKHKKALKGLLALLDQSPTVKTGGITAEVSRDRDKGRT